MNVNKIFYFLEVCKCKSISIASDSMNISQPAVTKAMKELECELGYSLFAREHNKMALTPEGRACFEMATRFKMNYNDFIAEATDLGTFKQKTIRIGIPTIMGTLTINKILPEFTRQYPSLKLEIFEVATNIGAEMLKHYDLDFFIGIMDKELFSNCNSRLIFSTYLAFAANIENPLAKKDVISKHMLINEPLVIIPKGSYHYGTIMNHFSDVPLNIVLHSNQIYTIKHMVINNLASTIIYTNIFNDEPKVRVIPLENHMPVEIRIVWLNYNYMSEARPIFIKYMADLDF